MSPQASPDRQGPAVFQAAEDNSVNDDTNRACEQDTPDSPTFDSEWEVILGRSVPSDCGSSAKSLQMYDASASTSDAKAGQETLPDLQVTILPQGSSDVTLFLTAHESSSSTPALSGSLQEQYQEQLRKAQETLLPQIDDSQLAHAAIARHVDSAAPEFVQGVKGQEKHLGSEYLIETPVLGDNVDDDLPMSTHMSMQADALTDPEPATSAGATIDNADASMSPSRSFQPALDFPLYDSTGELSFMSDGSFVNVENTMPEDKEIGAVHDKAEESLAQASPEAALPMNELSQQANTILNVVRQLSEDVGHQHEQVNGETPDLGGVAAEEDETTAPEAAPFQKYTYSSGVAAALQQCLGQLLSTIQAWSTSASDCLPSSASVYANTLGMRGSKPPLRQLDGLHWTLASGLALVSAALGLYIARSHNLKKQINNSNTELSRLLLKVINLQQSLQSPGRVPIIRHTSFMSTTTPFPLIHLL